MRSTAREQLARLLGGVGAGSFASRLTAPAHDLVLEVKGVGPLRFPIPRKQARLLLAKARPARYGRREQTLLDRRVRNTGEIPASQVKLDRRRWRRTLKPMLAALGTGLVEKDVADIAKEALLEVERVGVAAAERHHQQMPGDRDWPPEPEEPPG